MDSKVKSIFETEVPQEPVLNEECEKYGIDYHEPHFKPVMMIVGENDAAIPYFYLGTDIKKSNKLKNAITEYEKAFWHYRDNEDSVNPIKVMAVSIKYDRAERKLIRVSKAEKIKLYSRHEMNEYIKNYLDEKKIELEKAKSSIKESKEEMKLEK